MTDSQEVNVIPEVGDVFKEYREDGKDKNWQARKLNNTRLGEDFKNLYYMGVAERVNLCAEKLEYAIRNDGTIKLDRVWFCKNKLCPICNWRRALKHSFQASQVMDIAMEEYPSAQFLFLTLTIQNIPGDELNAALSELTKSFDRLFRRAKVKKNMIGFLRATEVTYNGESNTYHPHLHILMMVRSTYFKGETNYIEQAEWTSMWKQSAKLDYTPMVDIRKVKANNEKSLKKAVLETAKYPIKPIDTLVLTDEVRLDVVNDLYNGLFKKRQIAYGGELKRIFKELKLENDDLVEVDDDGNEITKVNSLLAEWIWSKKNYFRIK